VNQNGVKGGLADAPWWNYCPDEESIHLEEDQWVPITESQHATIRPRREQSEPQEQGHAPVPMDRDRTASVVSQK
jgi:hypothetical protein